MTSIGYRAFDDCYRLVEVYNKSNLNIAAGALDYGYVGKYAKNVYTEEGGSKLTTDENGFIIYDGNCLVNYIGDEKEITIPDCITTINKYAFRDLGYLRKVTIPDSVTSIGYYAFYWCEIGTLMFEGTVEQWNAIKKGSYWNEGVRATKAICSNGTVTL